MQANRTLPADWKTDSVRSVVDPTRPITYGVVQPGLRLEDGIPIIRGQDYSRGVVDDLDLYLVHPNIASAYKRSAVKGGDILFSIVGYLGQTAIVPPHLTGANITQTTARIAVKPPNHDRFFLHQFRSEIFAFEVRRHQKGSAQPGLNLSDVERMLVVIPPPEDQSRIAAVLDTVDEAIAKTEALIAKLRRVRAGLLHDLLTRGLDEHGQPRDPIAHPDQFRDSPLGRIPKEWETKTLSALCKHIGSGVTPRGGQDVYTTEGVTFIRSQNVTFEGLLLSDIAFIPEEIHRGMLRSEVFAHDVLFNITGASIGRCCPMPDGLGRANVNQHVCVLRVPDATAEDSTYLASVLASPIGQRQLEALNTFGNRQGLNYQQLGSFVLPWPDRSERKMIADRILAADAQRHAEEREKAKLTLLKSGLMSDLLTGRVRVPEGLA